MHPPLVNRRRAAAWTVRFRRAVLVLPLLAGADAAAGTIIECRAADGSITFADTRCPAGQQQVRKKTYRERPLEARGDLDKLENGAEFPADDAAAPPAAKFLFASRFVDALSSTQALRMMLTEYYVLNGEWPATFEDMGLSEQAMTSSTISASRLRGDGRLVFTLADDFGADKRIVLAPAEAMGGTRIEWRCYSNFPAPWLVSPMGQRLCESRYF